MSKLEKESSIQFNYQTVQGPYNRRLHILFGLNDEVVNEIKSDKCNYLYLTTGDFTGMADIELSGLGIRKLQLSQCPKQNTDWISNLSLLEDLSMGLDFPLSSKFDFSLLPNLKSFGGQYGRSVEALMQMPIQLHSLGLASFKGNFSNLSKEMRKSIKLLNVGINKHANLVGLDELESLEELTIADSNYLQDITPLIGCKSLSVLSIQRCNQVDYKSSLPKMTGLRKLFFENKSLESLRFLPKDNLEQLILGNQTRIEDLDVSAFLDFPKLRRVGFMNRKGYKYSGLEIQEMLDAKWG